MKSIESYYIDSMSRELERSGVQKKAAAALANSAAEMNKKAAMFNFGDYDQGGFNWSSLLVPLAAAAAAGYIGYNARDNGRGTDSALTNIKNYIGGHVDNIVRKVRPRPIYDYRRYVDMG